MSAENQNCGQVEGVRENDNPSDVRWAVNVLLEKIANKFEAWETYDLWRSDAAATVREFKHDLAALRSIEPPGGEVVRDAARYRRLQTLGCAPALSKQLDNGTVLRFSGLDAFVDADIKAVPSRGECLPPASGEAK